MSAPEVMPVSTSHQRRRCSDAADLSLDDRRALWRERLGAEVTIVPSANHWAKRASGEVKECPEALDAIKALLAPTVNLS